MNLPRLLVRLVTFCLLAGLGERCGAQELVPVGGLGGTSRCIAVHDGFVFTGAGTFLEVYAADDATPRPLERFPLPDAPWDIDLVGSLAYVALDGAGLMILDVSSPLAPAILGAYDTPGNATEVSVAGGVAYVADGREGLHALDVSDPSAPTLLSTFDTEGTARGVTVVGSLAYVADRSGGLVILDVSNPAAPVLLSISETPDAQSTTLLGTTAYVPSFLSGGDLTIFDVSDPSAPVLLGTYDSEGARAIVVVATDAGRIAYLADFYSGFHVLDVSDPGAVAPLGAFDPKGGLVMLAVDLPLVRTAGLAGGFQAYDVSDPTDPRMVARSESPGLVNHIAISGTSNTTFAGDTRIRSVDGMTTPSSPVVLATYEQPGDSIPSNPGPLGYLSVLEAEGSRLYAGFSQTFEVLDWSDPTSPTHVGASWTSPGTLSDLSADGDRVLVSGYEQGLFLVDYQNPWVPVTVGAYPPGSELVPTGFVGSIALAGDLALFALWDFETTPTLRLANLADPAAPVALGFVDTPPLPRQILVDGTTAYLACDGGELVVVDLSDPSAPAVLSTYDGFERASDLALENGVAFLAFQSAEGSIGGVAAIDVSDPAAPVFLDSALLPRPAYGVVVRDGIVQVANEVNGLTVLRFGPRQPTLANLSTRGFVGTDSGAMIAGLIVEGTEGAATRRVLVSGIGPDLANYGVEGVLMNPSLALMRGQTLLESNDDWRDSADLEAILASGFAPISDLESAVVADLAPGEYTAILSGLPPAEARGVLDPRTGVGMIQAFDLGSTPPPGAGRATTSDPVRLSNLSTRLMVGFGNRVMIGGFTVEGSEPKRLLIRALGPTLGAAPLDVEGALADPELLLFAAAVEGGDPQQLASNTDWTASADRDAIAATNLAPPDPLEPAILVTLAPGAYTAIVSGANESEGVALIEVNEAP